MLSTLLGTLKNSDQHVNCDLCWENPTSRDTWLSMKRSVTSWCWYWILSHGIMLSHATKNSEIRKNWPMFNINIRGSGARSKLRWETYRESEETRTLTRVLRTDEIEERNWATRSGTDTGNIWYWYWWYLVLVLRKRWGGGEYISRPGTGQIYCVVL